MDGIARGLPEPAIDLSMIEAELFERALDPCLLRPAQENLARRPMAMQRRPALDPVREQAKRKRVRIRIVIGFQNPVIGRQEKGWPRRAGREKQSGLALRKGAAMGSFDAILGEGIETLVQGSKAEILGQDHFGAPAKARLPAGLAQKIRD